MASKDVQVADEPQLEIDESVEDPQVLVEAEPESATRQLAKLVIGAIYGTDAVAELDNLIDAGIEADLDTKLNEFFGKTPKQANSTQERAPKNERRHEVAKAFVGTTVKSLQSHFEANGEVMSYQVARYYFKNVLKLG